MAPLLQYLRENSYTSLEPDEVREFREFFGKHYFQNKVFLIPNPRQMWRAYFYVTRGPLFPGGNEMKCCYMVNTNIPTKYGDRIVDTIFKKFKTKKKKFVELSLHEFGQVQIEMYVRCMHETFLDPNILKNYYNEYFWNKVLRTIGKVQTEGFPWFLNLIEEKTTTSW